MPAKPKYDWEAIQKDYQTGQYSNVVLGKMHGPSEKAIRVKAKKYQWQKDLVDDYQKGVINKLIQDSPIGMSEPRTYKTTEDLDSDKETVDRAVQIGVEVVRNHRRKIRRLQEIADAIADKLHKALVKEGVIDPEADKDFQILMAYKGGNESITDMAWKLAKLEAECVKLERQAFNLDTKEKDTGGGASGVDDRIQKRMEKLKK